MQWVFNVLLRSKAEKKTNLTMLAEPKESFLCVFNDRGRGENVWRKR